MDVKEILKTSRRFYRDHNLDDWRQKMPKKVQLAPEAEKVHQEAQKLGLVRAFAFPAFAVQKASLARLIDEMAHKPALSLAENQLYLDEPILADSWSKTPNGKILQRGDDLDVRCDGPYLLLFAERPAQNAWGRTGSQILDLFHAKGWHGFTVFEYLVLQRFFCERFGDHRFHEASEVKGHWLWLLDSASDAACSVAMANARGINIQACPLGNRDSRRGAVPALLAALGYVATPPHVDS